MAYTIMISEGQRALLAELLATNREVTARHQQVYMNRPDRTLEEHNLDPDIMIAMFAELPQVEAEVPGALHGFCL